jgi:hypothetical protein
VVPCKDLRPRFRRLAILIVSREIMIDNKKDEDREWR